MLVHLESGLPAPVPGHALDDARVLHPRIEDHERVESRLVDDDPVPRVRGPLRAVLEPAHLGRRPAVDAAVDADLGALEDAQVSRRGQELGGQR